MELYTGYSAKDAAARMGKLEQQVAAELDALGSKVDDLQEIEPQPGVVHRPRLERGAAQSVEQAFFERRVRQARVLAIVKSRS